MIDYWSNFFILFILYPYDNAITEYEINVSYRYLYSYSINFFEFL